jgi:hypothetical protein
MPNFFKTFFVVQSSRLSLDLGDAQIPTKISACRRYRRHDQELHTPLLPRTCPLIWNQFSWSGSRQGHQLVLGLCVKMAPQRGPRSSDPTFIDYSGVT